MKTAEILLFFACLLAGALLAGSETALYCLNRIRLRCRVERGDRSAVRLQFLLKDTGKTIIAILIGSNIIFFMTTAIFTRFLAGLGLERPQIASTLILAPILFVFSETLPKNIFQQHADVLAYRVSSVIALLRYALYPFVILLAGITRLAGLFFRKHAQPTDVMFTRQGLRYFFQESRSSLTPYLGQITDNIMSLHRSTIADAMIPLASVVSVDAAIGSHEVEQAMRQTRFSRLPVYDSTPSRIVGIFNCFDYLYEPAHREGIGHLVRPVIFFERATPIHTALHTMRASRQPMAVVTNGPKEAVGIVTLKDLVEQIVGGLEEQ
ncbi:MAG: DUF21 domain-containing protein [Planctomycetes bacterium]|nr:DUF21 domain-containing protein [Planctomycetota bacterium]